MARAPTDDAAGDTSQAAASQATNDAPAAERKKASAADNTVEVRAKGSFHGQGNFQGDLVHHGDTFVVDRGRAAELRANGLVEYTDESAEKEAAEKDPPAIEDTTNPGAITSRSFRRTKVGS